MLPADAWRDKRHIVISSNNYRSPTICFGRSPTLCGPSAADQPVMRERLNSGGSRSCRGLSIFLIRLADRTHLREGAAGGTMVQALCACFPGLEEDIGRPAFYKLHACDTSRVCFPGIRKECDILGTEIQPAVGCLRRAAAFPLLAD